MRAVEPLLAAVRKEGREPAGLRVATVGALNQQDGSVFVATDNLPGWAGFPLLEFAEVQFQFSAFVVNDAQAAALSELYFGQGQNFRRT